MFGLANKIFKKKEREIDRLIWYRVLGAWKEQPRSLCVSKLQFSGYVNMEQICAYNNIRHIYNIQFIKEKICVYANDIDG
jgi:hypothetical protein